VTLEWTEVAHDGMMVGFCDNGDKP